MHKKLLLIGIIVLLFSSPPVFAGYFDLGITLGTNAHLYEKDLDPSRMKLAWGGLSTGLTDVWEFDVQVDTRIIPDPPFSSSSVSMLIQRTLLGQRSTASAVAGGSGSIHLWEQVSWSVLTVNKAPWVSAICCSR